MNIICSLSLPFDSYETCIPLLQIWPLVSHLKSKNVAFFLNRALAFHFSTLIFLPCLLFLIIYRKMCTFAWSFCLPGVKPFQPTCDKRVISCYFLWHLICLSIDSFRWRSFNVMQIRLAKRKSIHFKWSLNAAIALISFSSRNHLDRCCFSNRFRCGCTSASIFHFNYRYHVVWLNRLTYSFFSE